MTKRIPEADNIFAARMRNDHTGCVPIDPLDHQCGQPHLSLDFGALLEKHFGEFTFTVDKFGKLNLWVSGSGTDLFNIKFNIPVSPGTEDDCYVAVTSKILYGMISP